MTFERLVLAIGVALSGAACNSSPSPQHDSAAPSVAPDTARSLSVQLRQALLARSSGLLAPLVATAADVHIETRDTLVETDEREFAVLKSRDASKRWLSQLKKELDCVGASCRYPGGLRVPELSQCAGDCCRADLSAGLERGTLYLKRACFAARENSERRLSQIVFVIARAPVP